MWKIILILYVLLVSMFIVSKKYPVKELTIWIIRIYMKLFKYLYNSVNPFERLLLGNL